MMVCLLDDGSAAVVAVEWALGIYIRIMTRRGGEATIYQERWAALWS